jgi:hypothetical protein
MTTHNKHVGYTSSVVEPDGLKTIYIDLSANIKSNGLKSLLTAVNEQQLVLVSSIVAILSQLQFKKIQTVKRLYYKQKEVQINSADVIRHPNT